MRCAVVVLLLIEAGCSFGSYFDDRVRCENDAACPGTAPFCVDFTCSSFGSEGEGEGDAVGEGEGDIGEGEGDVVVGEGEGEGDVVVGEGEGDVIIGEGEGEGEGAEGCRDGSDDGFVDVADLRACAGLWTTPNIFQKNGPDSAANLCADDWHICLSDAEVQSALGPGRACTPGAPGVFVTRQGTNGESCAVGGNDVVGCSDAADATSAPSGCDVLTQRVGGIGGNGCDISGFACFGTDSFDEGEHLVHPSGAGGVLCCRGAESNPCIETAGVAVDVDADAELGSSPLGTQSTLHIGPHNAILRFRSPVFTDGNLVSADLALDGGNRDAAVSVSVLDADWDEDIATIAHPRGNNSSWPADFPGTPVAIATPMGTSLVAPVPVSVLSAAPVRGGLVGPELDFVLSSPTALTLQSRESGVPAVLRANRCLRLAPQL